MLLNFINILHRLSLSSKRGSILYILVSHPAIEGKIHFGFILLVLSRNLNSFLIQFGPILYLFLFGDFLNIFEHLIFLISRFDSQSYFEFWLKGCAFSILPNIIYFSCCELGSNEHWNTVGALCCLCVV